MKNGIKKKIILLMSMFIMFFMAMISFRTTSYGNYQTSGSITWYYDVVNGEAVNVYIYSTGNIYLSSPLTIPDTLGGYPVTHLQGPSWSNGNGNYPICGNNSYYVSGIREVILPNSLKRIGNYAFRAFESLNKINLPDQLESIGAYAFTETKLTSITIPDSVISLGAGAFSECSELENVTLGQGIVSLNGQTFNNCPKLNDFHVPSAITTIDLSDFHGMKDVYIDNTEEDVNVMGERFFSVKYQQYPYIHFLDSKQTINTNLSDGIRLRDTETDEIVTEKDYSVGKNITFKVEKTEESNIENYRVFIESEGDYYQTSPKVIEEVQVDENGIFTIENITRNKTIYVQESKNGLDLSLRQYISHINGQEIDNSREPVIKVENGKLNYNHDKKQILRKTGDIITYCLRVYNEGTTDGTAKKVSMFIPEGLEFVENNFINRLNGWNISEDKKTATTELLKDKEIEAYSGANHIDYKNIYISLKVTQNSTEEQKRLVTIAEITESSSEDTDSTPGSITEPVDGTYMKEESEQSNENSYILAQEDDDDYESILVSKTVVTKYNLRINKIDGLDNALLNGATFELFDENMEVLKTGVTANGGVLDFGLVDAFGPGTKKYYIKEVHTPEGYKNYLSYIIEVSIVTEIEDITNVTNKVELDIQDIDVDTSKFKTKNINSKEDFLAMENNQTFKYVLTQDIDLEGVEWTPMNLENVFLDGKNHKISNLTLEFDESTNKKVGLFETYSGIIENLTLDNVDIKVIKTTEDEITETTEDDIHAVGGFVGYSKGIIFKNCKVTGKVESEVDNVGGFVGHSKAGTLDVYRNCTNEAKISTTSSNAGGLIGTALGPVQVISSTNKGNVTAGIYNAGGMIGTAECQGYTTDEVIGEYTDDNESIQITVKNQRLEGNYRVKIEKIDAKNGGILTGAKFTLYDRTKNPIEGYENIELTEGKFEIPAIVDHIGTDTYYLKETQAPEGYQKISDEYIKIEITKTWNNQTEEYVSTGSISMLTEEELERDTPKSNNASEVATNMTYAKENSDVEWKLNKVSISKNTVNEGNVTSANLNAAGLLGRAQCDVTITNASNTGTIQAENGNAAGILGEQKIGLDEDKKLYIKNVTNTGAINQLASVEYNFESCSGIVATINTDAEIYNAVNDGEINATQAHTAGIVANSGSDTLIIDNCANNGNINIQTRSCDVAGILARGVANKDFKWLENNSFNGKSEHRILNCTNKGDVSGSYNVGGIVGESLSKKVEICNCKLEDADITYVDSGSLSALGGIAGGLNNDIVLIDNCTVLGGNITCNGSSTTVGGIAGIVQDRFNTAIYQEITINNCNLTGVEVLGKGNTGGILGHTDCENDIKVLISNCNFINGTVKSDGTHGTYEQIGGILGYAHNEDYQNPKGHYIIKNSTVKNTDVGLESVGVVSGDNNVGGIFGGTYNTLEFKIEDNKVEDCYVFNIAHSSRSNSGGTLGGIAGFMYGLPNVEITNSDVSNTHLYSDNGNCGGISAVIQMGTKTTISNCDVDNITIDGEEKDPNLASGYAGIVSLMFNDANITNCTVKDSTIHNKNSSVAGVVGHGLTSINISGIEIDNTNLISDVPDHLAPNNASGGVIGWTNRGINVTDVIIKNSLVEANGNQTGGIVGGIGEVGNIENCEINNTTIKNSFDNSILGTNNSYNSSIGGIAGSIKGTINNCKVTNNSKVISTMISAGGILGDGAATIQNSTFEDSSVTSQTSINNTYKGEIGGIVGNLEGGELKNCNVTNATLTANSENVGGLLGTKGNYGESIIADGCNVDNLNIIHNNSVEFYSGIDYSTQPTRHVGGAVGTLCTKDTINNSKFKNITINVTGSTVQIHAGGLIGICNEAVQINSNNEIENISISNVAPSSITGGLIGFSTTHDEIVLSDMNLKNINVTGTYHTGGMIGSTTKAKMSNIVVEGLQVQETATSATAGGLVGRIQPEYSSTPIDSSIQLNNIEIKPLNNKANIIKATDYSHAGVLVGLAQKVELNTNINDKIKVSNTRVNSTATTAGLIGQTENLNNISNIELENVRMIANNHAGGIVGQIASNWSNPNTDPIIVSNIKATNVKATSSDMAGGLIGITNSTAQLTVQNIELENIETKANYKSGGIIGFTATSQAFNMSNVTAKHLTGTSSQDIGGLIGLTNNASVFNVDNVTLEDLKLTCANAAGQYSQNVGGIVSATPNPKFSNVHITDINMNSQHLHHIGGLVGAATQMNSNSSQGAEFKNITIDASEGKTNIIQGTTTDYDEYSGKSNAKYGGILVGFVNKKAKIDGTIDIQNTTLRDNGGYYNSQSGFGGLIGFANEYENPTTITNSIELSNVDIIGTGRVGGVIGDIYTLSNMHDITLNDVNVNAINGYSSAGLIGMAMKQQKGEGQDITFDVSNINVNGLTVNGNNGVEHIAGLVAFAPNVNVRQVVGENVTITGNAPNSIAGLVGIVAMYDDATNEDLETEISDINLSNLTISSTTGTSNMGGLVAEAMKPRVKDVILEDINITNNGNGSTAGVVGIVTSTYRTFTHTDLTSEGEFSNITIRKSEGAENSNKIIGTTNGNAAIISTIGKTTTNTIGTTSTIKVSDTDLQSNYGFAGIFGYAASGSDINNVIADNVHIIGGTSHAGVVAGQVQGNLSNCQVSNSSVINESGSGSFTGGLVGLKESAQPLANCSVTNTTVTSVSTYGIGGIAGLSKSPTSNCTITDSSVTSTANSMWSIGGAFGGVTNGDASDTTVTKCNAINTTVTAKSANVGGLIGLSDFAVSNSKVTDSTITVTSSSDSTGGLVGRITSTGSIDGCDVIDTTVSTYGNYVGGMVGFANKNINSSNVVSSTITSNSTSAQGVGGIIGHGSNMSGGDAVVTGCKVMDTTITGKQKVGGIAGAAVSKIANCYVGQKEGSTYEEGQNAVTITGTDSVGGVIGDPGVIDGDIYIMITMQGNNMNNVRINRNSRAREEGEDDIIFAMMGQHNRLADTYEPEEPRTETISANTASNCVLNINE